MPKKKETNFRDAVRKLQTKYALSVKVRDDIMKIVSRAYIEGGNDALK